ncbi:Hint domain-containing protein [Paracoccus albus]|uniref:Hint domain-containing protein n=1 Tax=Paracoccus albus TaxID=3017784 RepID=UPI0022F082D9|nr:Hint domain-containing protein [Paracoccus albus]WBU61103.1 Hint domain-containing protein [Paracoccus albus]
MANITGTTGGDSVSVDATGGTSGTDVTVTGSPGVTLTSGERANNINLYDGDDRVTITNASVSATQVTGSAYLHDGNDYIEATNSTINSHIFAGDGIDTISLTGSSARAIDMTDTNGADETLGTEEINLSNSTVSDILANTGAGLSVEMNNSEFGNFSDDIGADRNTGITLNMTDSEGGYVRIDDHVNGSSIRLENSTLSQNIYYDAATTATIELIDSSVAGSIDRENWGVATGTAPAPGSEGHATLSITGSTVGGYVEGGLNGDDTFTASNSSIGGNVSLHNGNNAALVSNNSSLKAVSSGDGDDQITVAGGSTATEISTGEGIDSVTIDNSTVTGNLELGWSGTDIGGGTESLDILNGSSVGGQVRIGTGADVDVDITDSTVNDITDDFTSFNVDSGVTLNVTGSRTGNINLDEHVGENSLSFTDSTVDGQLRYDAGQPSTVIIDDSSISSGIYRENNGSTPPGNTGDVTMSLTNSTISGNISGGGGGTGGDTLVLDDSTVTGLIHLADGDTSIVVENGASVGGVVQLGDGHHEIQIDGSTLSDAINHAQATYSTLNTYDISITNAEVNDVNIARMQGGGSIVLDKATIAGGTSPNRVSLGDGDDTLYVQNGTYIEDTSSFDGGNDFVFVSNDSTLGTGSQASASLNAGSGVDTLLLENGAMIRNSPSGPVYTVGVTDESVINAGLDDGGRWDVTLTGGDTFRTDNFEIVGVICFTADTMIDTSEGPVRAADLAPGDLVKTMDRGLQPVRWTGLREFDRQQMQDSPNLRPVMIRAGALGRNIPANDLLVSQQHRILLRNKVALRVAGSAECLVAAKQLAGLPGIEIADDMDSVTYVHFMCDQHEVVFADGTPTETLYFGKQTAKTLPEASVSEILGIFPELRASLDGNAIPPSVRPLIKGAKGRKIAERLSKNRRRAIEELCLN